MNLVHPPTTPAVTSIPTANPWPWQASCQKQTTLSNLTVINSISLLNPDRSTGDLSRAKPQLLALAHPHYLFTTSQMFF